MSILASVRFLEECELWEFVKLIYGFWIERFTLLLRNWSVDFFRSIVGFFEHSEEARGEGEPDLSWKR